MACFGCRRLSGAQIFSSSGTQAAAGLRSVKLGKPPRKQCALRRILFDQLVDTSDLKERREWLELRESKNNKDDQKCVVEGAITPASWRHEGGVGTSSPSKWAATPSQAGNFRFAGKRKRAWQNAGEKLEQRKKNKREAYIGKHRRCRGGAFLNDGGGRASDGSPMERQPPR